MTYLFITENKDVYGKVISLTEKLTGECAEIDFSHMRPRFLKPCGKLTDFNVSHSMNVAAIALSGSEVGADIELIRGKERSAVKAKLTAREKSEVRGERDFLINWTAKEAFIKMNGFTLSSHYRRLEFYAGEIYLDGQEQNCRVEHFQLENGVACICCSDGQTQITIL